MDYYRLRRKRWAENLSKIHGKVSRRTELAISRAYNSGELKAPIDKATDVELSVLRGVGNNVLADIRRLFPIDREKGANVVKTVELLLKTALSEETIEVPADLWEKFEQRAKDLEMTPEELFPMVLASFINQPDAVAMLAAYIEDEEVKQR